MNLFFLGSPLWLHALLDTLWYLGWNNFLIMCGSFQSPSQLTPTQTSGLHMQQLHCAMLAVPGEKMLAYPRHNSVPTSPDTLKHRRS